MRTLAAALVLLALLPLAQAQPTLDIATEELGVVAPLQDVGAARLFVVGACPENATTAVVTLQARAPAWASATLSPSSFTLDPVDCASGRHEREVLLSVQTRADAPAFEPAPIRLEARLEGWDGTLHADAALDVTVGYYSILDVQLAEAARIVRPGEFAEFRVGVVNHGNDASRVEVALVSAGPGLTVHLPDAFSIGTAAKGEVDRQEIVVRVETHAATGLVDRIGMVELRLAAANAERPALRGDDATVSLLVHEKTFVPGAAPLLAVALALLARRR